MINSNEVRLGNWVLENGKPVQVDAFDYYGALMADDSSYDDGYRTIKDPEGIPLSSQILDKLGFITSDYEIDIIVWDYKDKICIYQEGQPVEKQPFIFEWGYDVEERKTDLKYVHQLQNLFHALTGEELTFKS